MPATTIARSTCRRSLLRLTRWWTLAANVKTYMLGDRRVHALVDGALVNIAGLDGNPIEIMDLSFSVQALSIHHLASGGVPAGVNRFPDELDDLIARTKLRTLGIELDRPSAEQLAFRASWSV